jgi:hypothetical protein
LRSSIINRGYYTTVRLRLISRWSDGRQKSDCGKNNLNKNTPPSLNIIDLHLWVEKNSIIPNDHDQAFVVNSFFNSNTLEELIPQFRIFVSTKRLLEIASTKDRYWHVDATYKLISQVYPLLIIGLVDLCKQFHPTGWGITVEQKKNDSDSETLIPMMKPMPVNWTSKTPLELR